MMRKKRHNVGLQIGIAALDFRPRDFIDWVVRHAVGYRPIRSYDVHIRMIEHVRVMRFAVQKDPHDPRP